MASPHRQMRRESVIKPAGRKQLRQLGLQFHLNSRIRPRLQIGGSNQSDEGRKRFFTTIPFFSPSSDLIQATGLRF